MRKTIVYSLVFSDQLESILTLDDLLNITWSFRNVVTCFSGTYNIQWAILDRGANTYLYHTVSSPIGLLYGVCDRFSLPL